MSKHVDDERLLDEVVVQAQNRQKNRLDAPGYVSSDIDIAPIQYPQSVVAPIKPKNEVAPPPATQPVAPVAQPKKSKRMWTTDFGEGLAKVASLMGIGLGDTDRREAREERRKARTARVNERIDARNLRREERAEAQESKRAAREANRYARMAARTEREDARNAEREAAQAARIAARDERAENRAERIAERNLRRDERAEEREARASAKEDARVLRAEENAANKAARIAEREAESERRAYERDMRRNTREEERAIRAAMRAEERSNRIAERENLRAEKIAERDADRAEKDAIEAQRRNEREQNKLQRANAREEERVERLAEREKRKNERTAARSERADARETRRNERLASKAINTDGLRDLEPAGIGIAPGTADIDKSKIDTYVPTYIADEVKNKVAEQRRQEAEASDAKRKAYGQKLTDMVTPYMMGDQADAETINKANSVYDIERERDKQRAEEAARANEEGRLYTESRRYGTDRLYDNSGVKSDGSVSIEDAEIIDQTIEEEAPIVSRRPSADNTPASQPSGQEEEVPMSIAERQKMVASRAASDANAVGNRVVDDTPKTESADYEVARRERASEPVAASAEEEEEEEPMSVDDRKRMVEARAASVDDSGAKKSGVDGLETAIGEVDSVNDAATPSAAPSVETSVTPASAAPAGTDTASTDGSADKIDENIVPSVKDSLTRNFLDEYANSLYSESDREADEKKKKAAQWITAAQMLGDSIGALSNVYWTGKGANAMKVSPGAAKAAEATYQLNQDIRNAREKAAKAQLDATLKKYEMEMQRERERKADERYASERAEDRRRYEDSVAYRRERDAITDHYQNANSDRADRELKLKESRESRLKQQYGNKGNSSKGNSREFTLDDGKSVSIDNFNDDKIYRLYESLPEDVRASYENDDLGRSVRLGKDEMLDAIHRSSTDPRVARTIRKMAGVVQRDDKGREIVNLDDLT